MHTRKLQFQPFCNQWNLRSLINLEFEVSYPSLKTNLMRLIHTFHCLTCTVLREMILVAANVKLMFLQNYKSCSRCILINWVTCNRGKLNKRRVSISAWIVTPKTTPWQLHKMFEEKKVDLKAHSWVWGNYR